MIRTIGGHIAVGGMPTTAPPEVTGLEVQEEAVIQEQIVRQAAEKMTSRRWQLKGIVLVRESSRAKLAMNRE